MQFRFADYMPDTKWRELRRGSAPIALESRGFDLLVRLVQHLGERDASLRISDLSEVFSLHRADDLAKPTKSLRKAGLSDSASGQDCYVTWGTINNGLFLY